MEIVELIVEFIVTMIINPIILYIIGIGLIVTGIGLAAKHTEFSVLLSATSLIVLGLIVLFFKIRKDSSQNQKGLKK